MSSAGATDRAELLVRSATPSDAVCPIVDGIEVESSRLGGITIDMMSVGAGAVLNVALGPGATPVTLGVVVPFVLVVAAPLVTVAVVAVVMAGAMAKLGREIAPEVAAGEAPGGGGAGPVVVVAMVEGEVDVGAAVVVGPDCASAALASPTRTAAARARLPSLTAIAAPA